MIFNRDHTDAYGRRIEPESEETAKKPLFRSSYEKFFDGYTVKTIIGSTGKPERIRVYTGTLFRQKLSDQERSRKKLLYTCCVAGAILLLTAGLALPVAANSNIWCFISAMPCMVMYFLLLFALIAYLPASQDFKLHEYHDGAQMIAARSTFAARLPILPVVASFLLQLTSDRGFTWMNLLYAALLIESGILIAIMGHTERKITYISIFPEKEKAAD